MIELLVAQVIEIEFAQIESNYACYLFDCFNCGAETRQGCTPCFDWYGSAIPQYACARLKQSKEWQVRSGIAKRDRTLKKSRLRLVHPILSLSTAIGAHQRKTDIVDVSQFVADAPYPECCGTTSDSCVRKFG